MHRMKKVAGLTASVLVAGLVFGPGLLAQVKTVDKLKYPPLRDTKIPEPTRIVLDNGMVVMFLEDHELPLIDVSARIRTGSRLEPADKVGLAGLTGTVQRTGGTKSMSGEELDEFLEGRAAFVETGIGTTMGTASMGCLKDDFGEVLRVFADVLRNPVFDEDKIKVAKTQAEAGIARQNDDPTGIMFREWAEIIYGADSPYARDATYDTIGAITRDDLVAWHAKYYHPNRIILGISGDFDAAKAKELVEKTFGDWPKGPEVDDPTAAYNETVEKKVYYIEKDDMTQSNIIMGHLGIENDSPDYYAVQVMNQVLGGGFAARLFTNVRSKKALAYRVSGGVGSDWDYPGDFDMFMTTKVGTTAAGIDALFEEARNMTSVPPTDEEVDKAKSGLLNSFVFEYDSIREVLAQKLTYEYYGYPLDWLQKFNQGIRSVTTDQVRAAAAKYIHPDHMAILVVGPKEGQDRPLSEFGPVAMVDITIPEPTTVAVAESAATIAKGRELVALAVKGFGGAERLDGLKIIDSTGAVVLKAPQGEMELKVSTLTDFADQRLRQEMTTPMGKMALVMTPEGGFMQTPQGSRPLPASQLQEMKTDLLRDPIAALRMRNDATFKANALGTGQVAGTAVEKVAIEVDGHSTTYGVDPTSGRILMVSYRGKVGMNPQPGDVVRTFSDFRTVDGLVLPFSQSTTLNGEPAMSSSVDSLTVNGPLDETAFAQPAGTGDTAGGR